MGAAGLRSALDVAITPPPPMLVPGAYSLPMMYTLMNKCASCDLFVAVWAQAASKKMGDEADYVAPFLAMFYTSTAVFEHLPGLMQQQQHVTAHG